MLPVNCFVIERNATITPMLSVIVSGRVIRFCRLRLYAPPMESRHPATTTITYNRLPMFMIIGPSMFAYAFAR